MAKKKKKIVSKKTKKAKKKSLTKKKTVKKKISSKISKSSKQKTIKKTIKTLSKKASKNSTVIIKKEDKPKKIPKAISGFDEKIKEIFTKLINKNKVDGIYTQKIIEKAIPKRFRLEENIKKFQDLITSNNIKIYSDEEAKELISLAKEQTTKSEEGSDEQEKKQTGKTDDPVRLYLRDMGAVELLSREGEIAIAKRIEAGREKMIGAICESPMTIRSIINWKDAIKDGTMLLRDIVDLEATYDMSDISDSKLEDTLKLIESGGNETDDDKKKNDNENNNNDASGDEQQQQEDDEDDSLNVSLAAMEEKLKPKVLNDFNDITKLFKKLQKHSLELINADKKNEKNFISLEKKYIKVQKEMVAAMKAVHFNSTTIEALMEALYELNKKLLLREGKMLRMATSAGVKREDFISQYLNFNFEKNWIQSLLATKDKNWEKFINRNHLEINKNIEEIREIQAASELPLSEFRRIVGTVQQGERSANRAKKEMIESNLRLVISIAKK